MTLYINSQRGLGNCMESISHTLKRISCIALCAVLGCSPVGGGPGSPESVREELPIVASENTATRIPLIVERVTLKPWGASKHPLMPAEEYLSTMLVSSLARFPVFALYDKTYSDPKRIVPEPLYVKAILTESDPFANIDDFSVNSTRPQTTLGRVFQPITSVFSGIVGLYTGLPTSYASAEIKGVVTLDVVVTNYKTGEIVTSFPVSGTHIEKIVQVGDGFAGLAMLSSARSTYAGASRAALNEAARTLYETLYVRR